ncbi:MAG: nucleotidyl transferase AbiEii/AbiGii toxin family protein [Anaerolineales bacterium]|nr:nucleotidyl transferase AbiEii/AbiGii toxin family protein [Anaerolineales bacterium]
MKEPVRNIPASILARLRNQSETMHRPFAETLQYFAMERFLYRLSKTKYAEKFILKGGLLFYVWSLNLRRPTRDIDFRGYVSSDNQSLLRIIRTVIQESAPEDGIVFNPESVSIEETQIDADYQGIRVKLTASLDRTRIPLQIDIGFSDELASKAENIEYPCILPELKSAQIKSYPKEAVVAEKFHAMVRHAELNSRMKDYYDLWLLVRTFEFDTHNLQRAIKTTFGQRDTNLPTERPIGLTTTFGSNHQTHWNGFLEKSKLETEENNNFAKVIELLWEFIEPPLRNSVEEKRSNSRWYPKKGWKSF